MAESITKTLAMNAIQLQADFDKHVVSYNQARDGDMKHMDRALANLRTTQATLKVRLDTLERKHSDQRRDVINLVLKSLKAAGIDPAGCTDCEDEELPDLPEGRDISTRRRAIIGNLNKLILDWQQARGTHLALLLKPPCATCTTAQYVIVELGHDPTTRSPVDPWGRDRGPEGGE